MTYFPSFFSGSPLFSDVQCVRCGRHHLSGTQCPCAYQWPPVVTAPPPPPWTCPRCGNVYAGHVSECRKCNKL